PGLAPGGAGADAVPSGIDGHGEPPLRRPDRETVALDAQLGARRERHLDRQARQPPLERLRPLPRDALALLLVALLRLRGHLQEQRVRARRLADRLVAGRQVKACAEPRLEPIALLEARARLGGAPAFHQR